MGTVLFRVRSASGGRFVATSSDGTLAAFADDFRELQDRLTAIMTELRDPPRLLFEVGGRRPTERDPNPAA
jgi:hypothetical protein